MTEPSSGQLSCPPGLHPWHASLLRIDDDAEGHQQYWLELPWSMGHSLPGLMKTFNSKLVRQGPDQFSLIACGDQTGLHWRPVNPYNSRVFANTQRTVRSALMAYASFHNGQLVVLRYANGPALEVVQILPISERYWGVRFENLRLTRELFKQITEAMHSQSGLVQPVSPAGGSPGTAVLELTDMGQAQIGRVIRELTAVLQAATGEQFPSREVEVVLVTNPDKALRTFSAPRP